MKTPFIEDLSPKHPDPLSPPATVPFPWEEVFDHLDSGKGREGRDREDLASALKAVIAWLVSSPVTSPRAIKVVGQRAIALAWVLDPQLLDGRSLSRIAKGLRISPDSLQRLSGEVSRRYQVRNRGQAHAGNWRREAYAKPSVASRKTPKRRPARGRAAKESFSPTRV